MNNEITVEELVKKFDNIYPVKIISMPIIAADGSTKIHTTMTTDYVERDRIRSTMTADELQKQRSVQ